MGKYDKRYYLLIKILFIFFNLVYFSSKSVRFENLTTRIFIDYLFQNYYLKKKKIQYRLIHLTIRLVW